MIRRSPIFRNGDESLREIERAAVAGDPSAGLRLAMAVLRAGRFDDIMSALSLAGGKNRVEFYRLLAASGVRYPDPAFLAGLSTAERYLCCVSSLVTGHARWSRRVEQFGLQQSPHSVELVYPSSRGMLSRPDRDGNQDQYRGPEGLERARAQAVAIEAGWVELVSSTAHHKDGGFVEHMLFLTPTGYAQRTIYYSGSSVTDRPDARGVDHWDYDIRDGFLPTNWPNPVIDRNLGLLFESTVHDLERKIQKLLDGLGHGITTPQEHLPGALVGDASRRWMNEKPRTLFERNGACGGYDAPAARCLVVIPAATGEPPVTIGITARSHGIGPRTRRVNPAHFWPELAPWSDADEVGGHNKSLDKRLATWAATDADDRIRVVQGNVALVWQDWDQVMRNALDVFARSDEERARRDLPRIPRRPWD